MHALINGIFAAAVALAVTAPGTPAQAGSHDRSAGTSTRSLTVSFHDLDLSKQSGVSALYDRLRTAADKVCGPRGDGRDLRARLDRKRCHDAALDHAVRTVAHAGLSEVHLVRTGRSIDAGQQVAGTQ